MAAEKKNIIIWDSWRGISSRVQIDEIWLWKYGHKARLADPYKNAIVVFDLSDFLKNGRTCIQGYKILFENNWENEKSALCNEFKKNNPEPSYSEYKN